MRKPQSDEYIICPESRNNSRRQPESCFDTRRPDGSKITYGTIGKHHHGYGSPDCEWSGLMVEIEKK